MVIGLWKHGRFSADPVFSFPSLSLRLNLPLILCSLPKKGETEQNCLQLKHWRGKKISFPFKLGVRILQGRHLEEPVSSEPQINTLEAPAGSCLVPLRAEPQLKWISFQLHARKHLPSTLVKKKKS